MPTFHRFFIPPTIVCVLACLGVFGLSVSGQERDNAAQPLYAMTPAELPAADRDTDWRLPALPEAMDPDRAEALLEGLAAAKANERIEARRQLRETGLAAGPALLEAVTSGDPELALSAREVLRDITADHTLRRCHQLLSEEVQFGKASNELSGLAKTLSVDDGNRFARVLFAMRHQLGATRLRQLLSDTRGPDARRLHSWNELLGHQHGIPLFALSYSRHRPKKQLLPEHEAFLDRASASDNRDLNMHADKWILAAKLEQAQELQPLDGATEPAVRNTAVFRLVVEQALFVRGLGRDMLAKAEPDETDKIRLGLELLHAGMFTLGNWKSYKKRTSDMADFERIAAHLDHEDPRVRLWAAFGIFPPKISYKHNGSTRSGSLDTEFLTRHRAEDLLAIAAWSDQENAIANNEQAAAGTEVEAPNADAENPAAGPTNAFPEVAIGDTAESWFTVLHKLLPEHLGPALRVIATELVVKQDAEHEAVLQDLATSLYGFRVSSVPMKHWPAGSHQLLLEAYTYSTGGRDALVYATQDQFTGDPPAFLLPVFEHGPVPVDRGYAMIAAATCREHPEAMRILKGALDHPSANHRVEAAMALAFLGEEAGREAARAILDEEQMSETLRSKAAVALASMQDEASYAQIGKRFEAMLPQPGVTPSSSSTIAKARTRYLYALRDARPPEAESFVKTRLRFSKCPNCIQKSSSYCTYCSRDATAVGALAHLWKLTDELPEENKDKTSFPQTQWEFLRFLNTDAPKTLDFTWVDPVLAVPAGKSLDLRAAAAAKIDAVTGGATDFSRLAKSDPDQLDEAYKTWRASKAARPFLNKGAREKLDFELLKKQPPALDGLVPKFVPR